MAALAGPGAAAQVPLALLPPGRAVSFPADPLAGAQPLAARVRAGGRALLLAADPEYVPRPGLLYRDRVDGPFRVFLYAVDAAAQPLYFAVVVQDPSPRPLTLEVTRAGWAGPSSEFSAVAAAAERAYFLSAAPAWRTVRPGRPLLLDPRLARQAAHRGQLVNAILDVSASGPAVVSVLAARRPSPLPPAAALLPPAPGPLLRGTFPNADFGVSATGDARRQYLLVGENPAYLHGYSAVDGRPTLDYGNYGVLYDVQLFEAGVRARRLTLLFADRSLGYAGMAFVATGGAAGAAGARPVLLARPGALLLPRQEAVVLGQYRLRPGRWTFIHLQWMPAGASWLPAVFFVAPS